MPHKSLHGSYDDVMAMPFEDYKYVAKVSEYGCRLHIIALTLTAAICHL